MSTRKKRRDETDTMPEEKKPLKQADAAPNEKKSAAGIGPQQMPPVNAANATHEEKKLVNGAGTTRERKKPLFDINKFFAVAVPAFASLLTAIVTVIVTSAKDGNDLQIQINDLTNQIAQRDAQINALQLEVNRLKYPLQEILQHAGRAEFEWQWAGENWYGRVIMEKQAGKDVIAQAQVGLLEKDLRDDTFITGQVMNLIPGTGSMDFTEDGAVHLEFTAKKKDRRLGTEQIVFATGNLRQVLCYAGKIDYKFTETGSQYPGDMILVNYITPLDEVVGYWFSPNVDQPWFDRYIVDR